MPDCVTKMSLVLQCMATIISIIAKIVKMDMASGTQVSSAQAFLCRHLLLSLALSAKSVLTTSHWTTDSLGQKHVMI